MTDYQEQIQRIKNKLRKAKEVDRKCKVFGASSHQYYMNTPATQDEIVAFEQKLSIQLPSCYRAFISEIGNGGRSIDRAAAGPSYGIYPLGKNVNRFMYGETEDHLKNDCIIYDGMTDDFWESLNQKLEDDEASAEELEKEREKIYGGILPIGTQGCTYYYGLVIHGKYTGKVVSIDIDGQKPFFAPDNNFLDWYESWLDKVISGALIPDNKN
jgi:hypothetical protein